MLKVRYYKIELPFTIADFLTRLKHSEKLSEKIRILSSSPKEIVFCYTVMRLLSIRKYLPDGSVLLESTPTMDQHTIRIFTTKKNTYLVIVDPPRGGRIVSDFLEESCAENEYFIEPLEINTALIDLHVSRFDSATLVSAKIRDFEVYEGAIGRLEITSQSGLAPSIAPFLKDKFYKVDAVTYEVSLKYSQGLIYYMRNGTLRVSTPLVEKAFSLFEDSLE